MMTSAAAERGCGSRGGRAPPWVESEALSTGGGPTEGLFHPRGAPTAADTGTASRGPPAAACINCCCCCCCCCCCRYAKSHRQRDKQWAPPRKGPTTSSLRGASRGPQQGAPSKGPLRSCPLVDSSPSTKLTTPNQHHQQQRQQQLQQQQQQQQQQHQHRDQLAAWRVQEGLQGSFVRVAFQSCVCCPSLCLAAAAAAPAAPGSSSSSSSSRCCIWRNRSSSSSSCSCDEEWQQLLEVPGGPSFHPGPHGRSKRAGLQVGGHKACLLSAAAAAAAVAAAIAAAIAAAANWEASEFAGWGRRLLCEGQGVELSYSPMMHSRLFAEDPKYRLLQWQLQRTPKTCTREGRRLRRQRLRSSNSSSNSRRRRDSSRSSSSRSSSSGRESSTEVWWRDRDDACNEAASSFDTDVPLIAQFCGHTAEHMVAAGRLVEETVSAVDVNLGCPQGIARRGYYGAYLLEEPELIVSMVSSMHQNLRVPVTCKMRFTVVGALWTPDFDLLLLLPLPPLQQQQRQQQSSSWTVPAKTPCYWLTRWRLQGLLP
ncbi:hypothetical protein Emag_005110 [Eimeria magna]